MIPAVSAATAKFQAEVKDPKAAIIVSYTYVPQIKQVLAFISISDMLLTTTLHLDPGFSSFIL